MTEKAADRLNRAVTHLLLLVGGFAITYVASWVLESTSRMAEIWDPGRLVWSIIASLIAMAFYHGASQPIHK